MKGRHISHRVVDKPPKIGAGKIQYVKLPTFDNFIAAKPYIYYETFKNQAQSDDFILFWRT